MEEPDVTLDELKKLYRFLSERPRIKSKFSPGETIQEEKSRLFFASELRAILKSQGCKRIGLRWR